MWSQVLYFALNCRNWMRTLTQIPATLGFLHLLESKDGNCTVAEGHSAVRCYSWAPPNSKDVEVREVISIDHSSIQKSKYTRKTKRNKLQRQQLQQLLCEEQAYLRQLGFPLPKEASLPSLELHHQIAIFLLRHERSSSIVAFFGFSQVLKFWV